MAISTGKCAQGLLAGAALAGLVLAGTPKRALAADPAFQAVRDAIIHLGLSAPSDENSKQGPELDRWLGTGFLVDEECMVMTAKHVIEGVDRDRLLGAFQLPGNRSRAKFLAAEIVDDAAEKDVALVRLKDPHPGRRCRFSKLHPLELGAASIHEPAGEEVVVAGFPRIAPKKAGNLSVVILRKGFVASTEIAVDGQQMLLLDLSSVPGYSGSPVFHPLSQKVVGVILGPLLTERSADFAWATPVSVDDYRQARKRVAERDPGAADEKEEYGPFVGVDVEP